jgi:sec-independent protein translocase protein TatA
MLPFGPFELIIILVIFMIFFGAGKLGDLGGALRKGVTLYKQNAGIGEGDKNDKNKDDNKPVKG